jgi:uncharacterized membrane protein
MGMAGNNKQLRLPIMDKRLRRLLGLLLFLFSLLLVNSIYLGTISLFEAKTGS